MSAGSISLESALRTCKVDTAWASRVESDRFFNPTNMVCPVWNGMDTTGRQVCNDSFYTKRAGCNSATDRVDVENSVSRPQYMEYITLSANGIAGNFYGSDQAKTTLDRRQELDNINTFVGNFGNQYGSNIKSTCGYDSYNKHDTRHTQGSTAGRGATAGSQGATAYTHQQGREAHYLGQARNANHMRANAGNY